MQVKIMTHFSVIVAFKFCFDIPILSPDFLGGMIFENSL